MSHVSIRMTLVKQRSGLCRNGEEDSRKDNRAVLSLQDIESAPERLVAAVRTYHDVKLAGLCQTVSLRVVEGEHIGSDSEGYLATLSWFERYALESL